MSPATVANQTAAGRIRYVILSIVITPFRLFRHRYGTYGEECDSEVIRSPQNKIMKLKTTTIYEQNTPLKQRIKLA